MPTIVSIVEGHGEQSAIPLLIRKWAAANNKPITARKSIRAPGRGGLIRAGGIERFVSVAVHQPDCCGILVVLDADGDCPRNLGPALLSRAQQHSRSIPIGVVLAKEEYESWFLASADSLRGCRGLPASFSAPGNPESIRHPKEWLKQQMPESRYRETTDQPALTESIDFNLAKTRSDSFDKLMRVLDFLASSSSCV